MKQQQQQELTYKEKLNLVVFGCVVVQRAIVIVTRRRFGLQALGKECAFAFFLILAWAAATQDVFMYAWLVIWCVCMAKRRNEATKAFQNGDSLHTWSDGVPINLGQNENLAKLWYEPICTVILGGIALWCYRENGMPVRGLPCFLFCGAMCMRVVESIRIKAQERRMMAVSDARLEQESLVKEYGDKFGN